MLHVILIAESERQWITSKILSFTASLLAIRALPTEFTASSLTPQRCPAEQRTMEGSIARATMGLASFVDFAGADEMAVVEVRLGLRNLLSCEQVALWGIHRAGGLKLAFSTRYLGLQPPRIVLRIDDD